MSSITNANPGEVQAKRLETVYEQLEILLRQTNLTQRLRSAPSTQDWSAMQVIAHLAEMIPYWLHACDTLMAAIQPPNFGRSLEAPERLAGVEHGAAQTPDALLSSLKREVLAAAQIIRRMSADQRSQKGIHIRNGEMTVADIVEILIVAHAETHLAQVQLALQS